MAENLILLLLAALPLMGSPGPATLSLAAVGSAFGVRAGLPFMAGIASGTLVVVCVVATGVTGIVLALPCAVPVLVTLAGAYILWLAWKIATAPPAAERGAGERAPAMAGGLLLALANPKAYATFAAVFSGRVVVPGDPLVDAAVKIATLMVAIVILDVIWLALGSALARVMAEPRLGRAVNIGFAVLLVLSVAAAFVR